MPHHLCKCISAVFFKSSMIIFTKTQANIYRLVHLQHVAHFILYDCGHHIVNLKKKKKATKKQLSRFKYKD